MRSKLRPKKRGLRLKWPVFLCCPDYMLFRFLRTQHTRKRVRHRFRQAIRKYGKPKYLDLREILTADSMKTPLVPDEPGFIEIEYNMNAAWIHAGKPNALPPTASTPVFTPYLLPETCPPPVSPAST